MTDLGLTSGTLWSTDLTEGSVPTAEDIRELVISCEWTYKNGKYIIRGDNGNFIVIEYPVDVKEQNPYWWGEEIIKSGLNARVKKDHFIRFNVLEYNFNTRQISFFNVLPYFEDCWEEGRFEKDKVQNKEELKKWIERASSYQYWSRCQYEFLMAPWPYNEATLTSELRKIDVHQQIMININLITDILSKKFKIE